MSWDLLCSLRHNSDLPWLVAGDFNEILSLTEKRGSHGHPNSLMEDFSRALDDCLLIDLGMKGRRFTWEKSRGTENWVEERLDRAVADMDWCALYPHAVVQNIDVTTSDHSAIFVDTEKPKIRRCKRRFLFENAWLEDLGCNDIVQRSWEVNVLKPLPERLEACATDLTQWGGNFGQRMEHKIKECQKRMESLRGRYDPQSLAEFRSIDKELNALFNQQHTFWKQRAKQHWLNRGDRNTRFFHIYASTRRRKNRITRLKDDNGMWCENVELEHLITDYYKSIFSSGDCQYDDILSSITTRVSTVDNGLINRPFTADEVKEAVFSMAPDKAPGPDGFNPAFYQHFWNEIGNDVSTYVIHCLHSCSFSKDLNNAVICLVPKKYPPEQVGDLRPIALCNVIYKIAAKMIANRLKVVLESVVDTSQSAFLPGRLITDNVLIASEVMHWLNRKTNGLTGWCALKLDMAKAYDKMEWKFLEQVMIVMGFDRKFIDLIMLCVTTVKYRVLINGNQSEEIIPTRGLRQGDPLSPYLFILCAEGLSLLIKDAVKRNWWSSCRVARGAPGISHLFFADDSLLFFKATGSEAMSILGCLKRYELMSGQTINFNKSCIMFSKNTTTVCKEDIADYLGVPQAHNIGKYLGFPMGVGRNKQEVFSFIENKLRHRISGWGKKILSRAGKEILLKSVAQAIPTYTMSLYHLPISLCDKLERICNKFWWDSNSTSSNGLHWMAWDRMCTPKKLGGLGFKRLHLFNIALLAKQGWRLLTNTSSLVAKVMKARYFPNCSFLDAQIGNNPSFCWSSILKSQELLKQGCVRRIGNGCDTKIWESPWLPDATDPFISSIAPPHHINARVNDLIDPNTHDWDAELLREFFNNRDVGLILKIPVAYQFGDEWIWKSDIRGQYSVKNGYRLLSSNASMPSSPFTAWRQLWRLKLPPNLLNFLWRCSRSLLPVRNSLKNRGMEIDISCPFCNVAIETCDHIFLQCTAILPAWSGTFQNLIPGTHSVDFVGWLSMVIASYADVEKLKSVAMLWVIWRARNDLVWSNKLKSHEEMRTMALLLADEWSTIGIQTHAAATQVHDMNHNSQNAVEGTILCQVDAAIFSERDEATFGAILLTANKEFIAAKNGPLRCFSDPHTTEALAIKEALSWVKDEGYQHIQLQSDCHNVCLFLNSPSPDRSYAGCIIERCRTLARHFQTVSFSYINRSANILAHSLARAVNSQAGPTIWPHSPPSCIQHLLH